MRKKRFNILFLFVVPIISFMLIGIFAFSSFCQSQTYAVVNKGGAIYVGSNSSFTLGSGASITGSLASTGGAVYNDGTFTMNGGSITGNNDTFGAKEVYNNGTFTLNGGTVGKPMTFYRYGENGKLDKNGVYISFGSYPQTAKADDVTIDENDVDDRGYYLGSDGERYGVIETTYYGGSSKDYFKVEPINWRILTESNGQAIILAENVLNAGVPFYGDSENRTINSKIVYPNNYKYSNIRAYLNGLDGSDYGVDNYTNIGFLQQAFTEEEQKIIFTSLIDNSAKTTDSSTNTSVCENTRDKVWLLSFQELLNTSYGFSSSFTTSDQARRREPTDYAIKNGAFHGSKSDYYFSEIWWTRSPFSETDDYVSCVNYDGYIPAEQVGANYQNRCIGVVPALKIATAFETFPQDITSIYNDTSATLNLNGGKVYGSIYSLGNIIINGDVLFDHIELGKSAIIRMPKFEPRTLNITLSPDHATGVFMVCTDKDSLLPDDIVFVEYDNLKYELVQETITNGWRLKLSKRTDLVNFTSDWKTEIASSTYMTTTITPANITSIKFVKTIPSGYSLIGTLSSGLKVYRKNTTEIAFVSDKTIYVPYDSSGGLFSGLTSLTSISFSNLHTIDANMYSMFANCSALTSIDFANLNTANVTNMGYMFSGCSSLITFSFANFDVSTVTAMNYMFKDCTALADVDFTDFKGSSVTSMSYMFSGCTELSELDMSAVTIKNNVSIAYIMDGCTAIEDFKLFTPLQGVNMAGLFKGHGTLLQTFDLSTLDVSHATNMSYMFADCSDIKTLDLSNFYTEHVTDMSYMFYYCRSLQELDLSSFNTRNVKYMQYMFAGTLVLKSLDIRSFKTPKLVNANLIFNSCSTSYGTNILYLDMSNMYFGNVASTTSLGNFKAAIFKSPYAVKADITLSTYTNSQYIYYSEENVKVSTISAGTEYSITLYNKQVANVTKSATFPSDWKSADVFADYDVDAVTEIRFEAVLASSNLYTLLGTIDTISVYVNNNDDTKIVFTFNGIIYAPDDCSEMFAFLPDLKKITFNNFNTSRTTAMYMMFYHCYNLETLNLNGFNTTNVTDMEEMFSACLSLKNLHVNFSTENVEYVLNMFNYQCGQNLTELDLSNFDLSGVINAQQMFPTRMLNLERLMTPYNNSYDIILTRLGVTLYDSDGNIVKTIPAGTTESMTLYTTKPTTTSSFAPVGDISIYPYEIEILPQQNMFNEDKRKYQILAVLNDEKKLLKNAKLVEIEK